MGKTLQIRVWATTYDPGEVLKRWKKLSRLLWPEDVDESKVGVLQMAENLPDKVRFGLVDKDLAEILRPGTERVDELHRRLDKALADWDPHEANTLSEKLEDELDDLEKLMPKQ